MTGTAIEYFAGNITGCEFVGSTASVTVPHAIYFYTANDVLDGAGAVAGNTFKDSRMYADTAVAGVTISDNVFWQEGTTFSDPLIDFYRPQSLNIHDNRVLGGSRDFIYMSGPAGTPSQYISIRGNTVDAGRIRIPAELEKSEIVGNSIRDAGEIVMTSTLANRDIGDVTISGNVLGSVDANGSGRIDVTGTDMRVASLVVEGNIIYSQNRPTAWGADSAALIDVDMGTDALATTIKTLKVSGNVIRHNRTSTGTDSAYGILLADSTGTAASVVTVDGNMLYGSDGITVTGFVSTHVRNNSLFRNGINPAYSGAQQLTVTGDQVVVSGNTVESGDDTGAPDRAGTASVVYVNGVTGSVRNNDIWGQDQGALTTVLSHSSEVFEDSNTYHGVHSAQAGSTFTNGIVAF